MTMAPRVGMPRTVCPLYQTGPRSTPRWMTTPMAGVLESIPVSPSGWTDLAEMRQLEQRWRSQRRNQQSA